MTTGSLRQLREDICPCYPSMGSRETGKQMQPALQFPFEALPLLHTKLRLNLVLKTAIKKKSLKNNVMSLPVLQSMRGAYGGKKICRVFLKTFASKIYAIRLDFSTSS